MICDRELEKMSGNSFVSQNWAWIFNRRADIKILRLWIVSRNEKEPGRVFVVNAGRIHESSRAGRLERVRQLSNLKRAKIIRQRYKIVLLQEADHFCFATFVRFQERFLVRRDVLGAFWIGIGQFWIREKSLERTVTSELGAPNHLHLRGVERQKQNVFEIIIVVRFAHWREIGHLR